MRQAKQAQTQKPATPAESKGYGDWAKRHRAFNEKLLDKIARDPRFRRALLDDPEVALRSAGLDRELRELERHDQEVELGKAFKECAPLSCVNTCSATCKTVSCLTTNGC